jgi:protein TonB
MRRSVIALSAIVLSAVAVSAAGLAPRALADPEENVTMPSILPESYVAPVYPEDARKAGAEGTVLLSLVVTKKGVPKDVTLAEGVEGWPSLGKAALKAVKKWRFEPGTKDGKPVDMEIKIPVKFKLDCKPDKEKDKGCKD